MIPIGQAEDLLSKYPDWIDGHCARESGLQCIATTGCEYPDDFVNGWNALNDKLENYQTHDSWPAMYSQRLVVV